ncbi:MAG TPA: hypothetical protein VK968_10585 [Roseimicrobium sp.]|nr:hypothetical protein [Roseimicrobium sp.]
MIAIIGSTFGAAYLVRADGSGSISKEEIKTALNLTEYQFQNKAITGQFKFTVNRTVDYSVPCREVGTTSPIFYYNFHSIESNVPMNSIPRYNDMGAVTGFKLNRATGGTITVTDAGGQPVMRAHCPDGYEYPGGPTEPTGPDTIITPKQGGLIVNHTLIKTQ